MARHSLSAAGDPWEGDAPLCNLVLGGTEIGEDVGYGPARYITPDDVKAVATAITEISPDHLAARFDFAAFNSNEIYPKIWDEDNAVDFLIAGYRQLRAYYADAAAKGNGMLKYLN